MRKVRYVLAIICGILLVRIVVCGLEAALIKNDGIYDFQFSTYSYKNLDSPEVVTLDETITVVQPFVAEGKVLNSIILFLRYAEVPSEKSGNIYVDILDEAGNSVANTNLDCRGIASEGWFGWRYDFEVALSPDEVYYLELTAVELGENSFELRVGDSNGGIASRFPDLIYNDTVQNDTVMLVSAGWSQSMMPVMPRESKEKLWLNGSFLVYALLLFGILSVIEWSKKKNRQEKLVLGSGIAVFVLSVVAGICVYQSTRPWYQEAPPIAHALGGVDGISYTNSKDAFEYSIERGYRYLEADFCTTSDGHLVLRHDWGLEVPMGFEAGYVPTLEEFTGNNICGKYTSLSALDLLALMDKHKDVYIITDSKDGAYDAVVEHFTYLVETAKENGYEDLLDRFIVQIYNDDMLHAVESVYSFENYIYTLYQRGSEEIDQLIDFCRRNEIEVVTAFDFWWYERPEFKEKMKNSGLVLYIHTVNDLEAARGLLEEGVTGIYTDFITAEELER